MRILVVEDDKRGASYLVRGLSESGHVVDHASDGETGLAMALEGIYDAMVLDRRLPRLDGLAMLKRLREQDRDIRVLILSASGATADRLEGFAAGADAYLCKPYVFAELLARLEVLGRQAEAWRDRQKLVVADLELDLQARTARRADQAIVLQRREFLILAFLMRHAGQVVTRSMLLEAVWDYDFEPRGNVVDMHVHRLRQKLEPDGMPPLIHTVVGSGYMIRDPAMQDVPASVAG